MPSDRGVVRLSAESADGRDDGLSGRLGREALDFATCGAHLHICRDASGQGRRRRLIGLGLDRSDRRLTSLDMRWSFPLLLFVTPAFAETCPPVPDRTEELAVHYAGLLAAGNELEASPHNAGLWEIWLDAPDAAAQELLDRGMNARRVSDYLGSIDALDRLVEYCPEYAEGYNQRAFTYFLWGRHELALADLERTLEIIPDHIGALSGKGLTLIELGRNEEAQDALKAAVALHPWLAERFLIEEPAGTDL